VPTDRSPLATGPDAEPPGDGFGPVLRGDARGGARVRADGRSGDDGFGPPVRGRARRRVWRHLLKGAVALVVVAALAAVGTGAVLLVYTSMQLRRTQVRGLSPSGSPRHVLVVGTDSREGLTPEQLQALGTEPVTGTRTDTIFLLSVRGGRAAMLSFPRDLLVTNCDGQRGRINGAYRPEDPSCLVETVSRESGIPVGHYVEVNFLGFLQLVDAVDGVSIYLEEPLVDRFAGVNLPAGCQVLGSREALGFVRARHVDSDLGRIARQQRFLRELASELTATSTLTDVPGLFAIARDAGRAVTADTELGIIDLLTLARAGRGLAGGGLATYTVPATGDTVGGAAVLVPLEGEADALYGRFRDGSILDVPPEGELRPADVAIEVRNGTPVEGLAAQGKAYLEERGFPVRGVANAEPASRTVVRHPPGMEAGARLVAAQLPGATVEQAEGIDAVVVVLGADADLSGAPTETAPQAPAAGPGQGPPAATAQEAEAVGAGPVPEVC
jgi:LCP family protein required for cell wall assembly